MTKFAKSSNSKYLKKLKTMYPVKQSTRSPYGVINDRITHNEFKMVLPMYPKDNVSMKGSNTKPCNYFSYCPYVFELYYIIRLIYQF